jgi:hypothetical protein
MASCPDLKPDPHHYQQLVPGTPTSSYDCTAYTAAWCCEIYSCGADKYTGRQVRLASNEPVPDPRSPGLNFPQVDAAVYKLSRGGVNLALEVGVSFDLARKQAIQGRRIGFQIKRQAIVSAGKGGPSTFSGGHAVGAIYTPDGRLLYYDPLVPYYQEITWSLLKVACGQLDLGNGSQRGFGLANVLATRDVVPYAYHVRFDGHESFWAYKLNSKGEISGRKSVRFRANTGAPCHRKAWHGWPGHTGRTLTKVDSPPLVRMGYPYVSVLQAAVHYQEIAA